MSYSGYKLKLEINTDSNLPIGLTLVYDNPDNEEQLLDIEDKINTGIRWLQAEKENQRRFFNYRKEQK